MSDIRPYPRVSDVTQYAPPTKPPKASEPAVMSPNTAWLNAAAAYWTAKGSLLVWDWNTTQGRYTGFTAWRVATDQKVAEVRLVE